MGVTTRTVGVKDMACLLPRSQPAVTVAVLTGPDDAGQGRGHAAIDRDRLWALVHAARAASGGACRQQAAQLVGALGRLPTSQLLAFDRIATQLWAESSRWELWGAAYLLNGGCSADGFDYFRGWLLGQGRATWAAALDDPDSLASHWQVRALPSRLRWDGPLWCEALLYVAGDAYRAVTGEQLPALAPGAADAMCHPPTPLGQAWDFDDPVELRRRLPRLWALLGWHATP
jgi:hypothetical protein